MTKKKHDAQYYQDLDTILRAERLRKKGFLADVVGSVDCPDCTTKWPLTDQHVETEMEKPWHHEKGCPKRREGGN